MSNTKNIKLNIHSHIDNLEEFGLSSGAPEINDSEHSALIRVSGNEIFVSYEESSEGGKVFCDIKVKSKTVTVSRMGAICSVLVFEEGKTYSGIYEIAPYKFDISVKTKRLKNSFTESGGSIDILYDMTVGGASKRCRMKITASEANKK